MPSAGALAQSFSAGAAERPEVKFERYRSYDAGCGIYGNRFKRPFDILFGVIFLILLSPIILLTVIAVFLSDGRPVVFAQDRIGLNGKIFRFYKFRTMVRNAESQLEHWRQERPELWENYVENNFKVIDDPRLIKLGRFLRKYSLDETPQLVNVLRGDMSLIGPRPLPRYQVEESLWPQASAIRQTVRPGITGLWQVSGRSNTEFHELLGYDTEYVRTLSLQRDLFILCKTVRAVLNGAGAC